MQFQAALGRNSTLTEVLTRAAALSLPNWYLTAGACTRRRGMWSPTSQAGRQHQPARVGGGPWLDTKYAMHAFRSAAGTPGTRGHPRHGLRSIPHHHRRHRTRRRHPAALAPLIRNEATRLFTTMADHQPGARTASQRMHWRRRRQQHAQAVPPQRHSTQAPMTITIYGWSNRGTPATVRASSITFSFAPRRNSLSGLATNVRRVSSANHGQSIARVHECK